MENEIKKLDKDTDKKISQFLAYMLRHNPGFVDDNGWATVNSIISESNQNLGFVLNLEMIESVVFHNKKKRFSLNEDKTQIMANQGHSVEVDLQLDYVTPPDILYHGTATRFIHLIEKEGLKSMDRLDVHLSIDIPTATNVGARHGKPHILTIDAKKMHANGYLFKVSKNGVWLTDTVPLEYIDFGVKPTLKFN
jgi:putative RNA 2'-phosphotransferase